LVVNWKTFQKSMTWIHFS